LGIGHLARRAGARAGDWRVGGLGRQLGAGFATPPESLNCGHRTIKFPAAGPQLLTFRYGKGNNFAYFEFELVEPRQATKP
jgi:hypothetical protein